MPKFSEGENLVRDVVKIIICSDNTSKVLLLLNTRGQGRKSVFANIDKNEITEFENILRDGTIFG